MDEKSATKTAAPKKTRKVRVRAATANKIPAPDLSTSAVKTRKISASKTTWSRFEEIARDRGTAHAHMAFTMIVNDAWDRLQKK